MSEETPVPQTQYAESDGLSIAYQVFGGGTTDLVLVPGIVSHLDMNWEHLPYARMLRQLARSFRVIMFDKRGQGLSDGFAGVPTLEERMDDVRDVMRAAGSRRAVIFAVSEGGAMATLSDLPPPDSDVRPTLKTIAAATGLAIATVSRALKDAPDIGEDTTTRS